MRTLTAPVIGACCVIALTCGGAGLARGDVNLELRPPSQTVRVGNTVSIGLFAVSDTGGNEPVGRIQAVLTWNATRLQLTGVVNNGPYSWLFSGFGDDSADDGLNNTFADGNALYEALAQFGGPAMATPAGLLVTTLQFTALDTVAPTTVSIVPQIADTVSEVLDALPPGGVDVTGTLGSNQVTIICLNLADCNDHNPCTDDSCVAQGCVHAANDGNDPEDGLFCNGVEDFCQGGMIVYQVPPPNCNDGISCTADSCDENQDLCVHPVVAGKCLIGGVCYTLGELNPANDCEVCNSSTTQTAWSFRPSGAACGSASNTECDNPNSCNGSGTCSTNNEPDGTACSDEGNPCTDDQCAGGSCAHPFKAAGAPCGSSVDDTCTNPDTCDASGTCLGNHATNGTNCDDGVFCTAMSSCLNGVCSGSGNACPGLVCDEVSDACKGVNLNWSPQNQGIAINGTVNIELVAASAIGVDQSFNSAGVIIGWDPSRLQLLGIVNNGPYEWVLSGFPNDCGLDGINAPCSGLPANDGNAYYEAVGQFSPAEPAAATPSGIRITTIQFKALTIGPTSVQFIPVFGTFTQTQVLDADVPGLNILTSLGPNSMVNVLVCTSNAHCADNVFCNGVESCVSNQCVEGSYPCGMLLCDETLNACVDCLDPAKCSDGVFCNGSETCQGGNCGAGVYPCPGQLCDEDANVCVDCFTDPNCNDGLACTADICVAGECIPVPNDALCDDGAFCNGQESCLIESGCQSPGNPCPDPVTCEEATETCGGCERCTVIAEGSRYIEITPPPGPDPVALWVVGVGAGGVSCVALYVQDDGTLNTIPVFKTPAQWGVVHLHGEAIIPDVSFRVHTDCGVPHDPLLSEGRTAKTWRFGDVNGDGLVDLDDILTMFDAFTGEFSMSTLQNVDVASCDPNGIVDLDDILLLISAFSGESTTCASPCPAISEIGTGIVVVLIMAAGYLLFDVKGSKRKRCTVPSHG